MFETEVEIIQSLYNYMDVVYHDYKAIDDHPLICRQELHTFDHTYLVSAAFSIQELLL